MIKINATLLENNVDIQDIFEIGLGLALRSFISIDEKKRLDFINELKPILKKPDTMKLLDKYAELKNIVEKL